MDNSERTIPAVSTQSDLIEQVAEIIFGDGPALELCNREREGTPVPTITTEILNQAQLFARAAGFDLEFRALPETRMAARNFATLFHILAGQAEIAVYDYKAA